MAYLLVHLRITEKFQSAFSFFWEMSGKVGWIVLFSFFVAPIFFAQAGMNLFECQIEGKAGENYSYAVVQGWIPSPPNRVKGILCIVLHPHANDAMILKNPESWRQLAAQSNFALVAVSFVGVRDATQNWSRAREGTGKALLVAFDKLGEQANSSSLQGAPIVIAGVCAAGQFAYEFAGFASNRTRSFVTIGGGKHDVSLANKVASVPALLVATPDRGDHAFANMLDLFEKGRGHKAPWQVAFEKIKLYDEGGCSVRVRNFLKHVLKTIADVESISLSKKLSLSKENAQCDRRNFNSGLVSRNFFNTPSGSDDFSFVGKSLPTYGFSKSDVLDLGKLEFVDEAAEKEITFQIEGSSAGIWDEISIANDPKVIEFHVSKIGEKTWQVTLTLNLESYPTGTFHLEVPVRFYSQGQLLFGGFSIPLHGTILGDVRAIPPNLFLGNLISAQPTRGTFRLSSQSGTPFEVVEVQHSGNDLVTAKTEKVDEQSTVVRYEFSVPPGTTGQAVAGYFLVRIKSSREQILKLFYYGNISKKS